MLKSAQGVYRNGKIELIEIPDALLPTEQPGRSKSDEGTGEVEEGKIVFRLLLPAYQQAALGG